MHIPLDFLYQKFLSSVTGYTTLSKRFGLPESIAQWSASTLPHIPAPFLTFCFSKTREPKIVHFDLFHSWTRPAHAALIFRWSSTSLSFVGGAGWAVFFPRIGALLRLFLLIPLTGQITLMIFTVKPALHIWNRSHLVVVCNLFYALLGLLCKCFVEGSVSKFMRDVNL